MSLLGLLVLEIWMEWPLGHQLVSLFVEFDHFVYVRDAQTNGIKILTSLKQTADSF